MWSEQKNIDVQLMHELAHDFPEHQNFDLLKFGFLINQGQVTESDCIKNHVGASRLPKVLNDLIGKEDQLGATMGPFDKNPLLISLAISPLNAVFKSTPGEERVVLDLSFPPSQGINAGITEGEYLGKPYKMILPGLDDMINLIHRKGPGCLFFK